jgi:2'-5' RNA ligase
MRAFIAIELPEAVQSELARLQGQLAKAEADVKWVEEDNLHVTMRFLGEIPEPQRQAIEQLLSRIASHTDRIPLSLSHVGAFPSLSAPRVIWVGIEQGSEALSQMAREIEEGLQTLDLPKEDRAFAAHVTVGRVRSFRNRAQLTSRLKEVVWEPPEPFVVAHLTFFQSALIGSGPIYTPIARLPFKYQDTSFLTQMGTD